MSPVSTRLPSGASLDSHLAEAIASDSTRLKASYIFWRGLFDDLKETPFGSADTDALKFAKSLADEDLRKLLPTRKHLTTLADESDMARRSGCLMSADEIASAVSRGKSAASLFSDLRAFQSAALGAGGALPLAQVARGVYGGRELFDAVQRFHLCKGTSEAFQLSLAEALALFRQEGNLCITPPRDSFVHGPLINTEPGRSCRSADVSLFDTSKVLGPVGAERPGFDLVFAFQGQTDAAMTDESKRFETLFRNIVAICGVDSVVAPRLSSGDELEYFMQSARKTVPPPPDIESLNKAYRDRLATTKAKPFSARIRKSQKELFDWLETGLIMSDIEQSSELSPASTLLKDLRETIVGLMDAHGFEGRFRLGHLDVHLIDDLRNTATERCLEIQAEWFDSRMRPITLVARSDRATALQALPRFSPFLTYLRFHTGDATFVGILLRSVVKLDSLNEEWKKRKAVLGTSFRDAFSRSKWSKPESVALASLLETHWKPHVKREDAWRHIGLVSAIDDAGGSPPWLKPAPKPDAKLRKTADVALRLVQAIQDQELMESLQDALEFTPISDLITLKMVPTGAGIADPRRILVNAHSFERIRIAYAEALNRAGV